MMPLRMRAWLGAMALAAFASPWATAQVFRIIDLGPNVYPGKINDAGLVVGNTNLPSSGMGPPQSVPFVWRDGTLTTIQPAGWRGGTLAAVNSAGVAVGQAQLDDPLQPTSPFIYDAGVVTLIPVQDIGAAAAINDAGRIGGFVQRRVGGGFGGNVPFVRDGAVLTLIPPLASVGGGGVSDIAADGTAVGAMTTADLMGTQAFLWRDGTLTLLPGLGEHAGANAINDSGLVVGTSTIAGTFEGHAVAWENGNVRDLGGIPGAFFTTAWDVNAAGVIVGEGFGPGGSHAFVYRDGAMTTLDALAGAQTGWQLMGARGINRHGHIVGFGFPPGATQPHGFILLAEQRTLEQMIAELIAAIEAMPRRSPAAGAVIALLRAHAASSGANLRGLCNNLARLRAEGTLADRAAEIMPALGCPA